MPSIAIVDDNETWCFVLASRLRQQGYEVSTFTDAHVFLHEAEHYDLALIDFSLPPRRYQLQTDGIHVVQQIKQQLANPPLLILISAYFTEDILSQSPDLCDEADLCLSKKVDSTELLHHIERLLATRDRSAKDDHPSHPSHPSNPRR